MVKSIEVLFSPAEYATLGARDLSQTLCVVFDIFRATTTMLTALSNGAKEIVPVAEISETITLRERDPNLLLAGERGGLRIRSEQTGSIDFDFGNSPREFSAQRISGRSIAITTTNGTRALRACSHAAEIQVGALLNLAILSETLSKSPLPNVLITCAGTADEASLEDTYVAGALCDLLRDDENCELTDSAEIAFATYSFYGNDFASHVENARNGRKLLSIPELRDDIQFCLQRDTLSFTATMKNGVIRRS